MKKLFSEIPYIEGKNLVLKQITQEDAQALTELVQNQNVYRYLPTFLFEKQYDDIHTVIDKLYDECFRESIILGVYRDGMFCGIAEMYGYRDDLHKISIGYRALENFWGQEIASEALQMMIEYLYNETDIEIITASTMLANKASARVLEKNGFMLVASAVDEDWGYQKPTLVDKWIR